MIFTIIIKCKEEHVFKKRDEREEREGKEKKHVHHLLFNVAEGKGGNHEREAHRGRTHEKRDASREQKRTQLITL